MEYQVYFQRRVTQKKQQQHYSFVWIYPGSAGQELIQITANEIIISQSKSNLLRRGFV